MEPKYFSKILKKKLGNANLARLSRELDIPHSLLHQWVTACRLPSFKNIEHIRAIANHLGLTLDELLCESIEVETVISIVFEERKQKYRLIIQRVN